MKRHRQGWVSWADFWQLSPIDFDITEDEQPENAASADAPEQPAGDPPDEPANEPAGASDAELVPGVDPFRSAPDSLTSSETNT
jgi:hypothetical protein